MGYDEQYISNITHYNIIFTKKSIEELSPNISGVLENIIYREDEIITVCKNLLPYLLLIMILSATLTIGLVFFLIKNIKYNFRRLVLLGFGKKELDRAYNRLIYGMGILAVIIVFLFQ